MKELTEEYVSYLEEILVQQSLELRQYHGLKDSLKYLVEKMEKKNEQDLENFIRSQRQQRQGTQGPL
jgi:uncharacterized coiled-coil protein SlyX